MKLKFKKILLPFLMLPMLSGCSNDNQVISGDFTVGEAKKYANDYLKLVFNKDTLEGHEINIYLNLGRFNDNKGIILLMDYRPIDMSEGMECDYFREQIGSYLFNWDKSLLDYSCQVGRYYEDDKVYTLTEAYEKSLLSIDDIKTAHHNLEMYNSIDGVRVDYKFTNKIA